MRYQIKYLPSANQDILAIAEYLSTYSPAAMGKFLAKLETLIADLRQLPLLWEEYPEDPFYRRIVIGKYLVFYHINDLDSIIEIHRVLYGARDLPSSLKQ